MPAACAGHPSDGCSSTCCHAPMATSRAPSSSSAAASGTRPPIPSTVYRTLDVLEELGLVRHAHGPDGREEYHVLPETEHGHLHCAGCGTSWDIGPAEAAALAQALEAGRGFRMDLSHLTVSGLCTGCATGDAELA